MIPADVIYPDFDVRVRFENPLDYLGKFLTFESLNPVLKDAHGPQHGLVIGVMVTIPELNLPQELLVVGDDEPDFISLNEVQLLSISSDPPKDFA